MIRFIAAIDDKRGLASKDKIPWKLPTDIKYYHQKTEHSNVCMGFRTYSLYSHPLSDKNNYVAVRPGTELRDGYIPVENSQEFLISVDEDIWVIGGGGLFAATIDVADELYLTRVEGDFDCDIFFPEYKNDFVIISHEQPITENDITFHFEIWRRK